MFIFITVQSHLRTFLILGLVWRFPFVWTLLISSNFYFLFLFLILLLLYPLWLYLQFLGWFICIYLHFIHTYLMSPLPTLINLTLILVYMKYDRSIDWSTSWLIIIASHWNCSVFVWFSIDYCKYGSFYFLTTLI